MKIGSTVMKRLQIFLPAGVIERLIMPFKEQSHHLEKRSGERSNKLCSPNMGQWETSIGLSLPLKKEQKLTKKGILLSLLLPGIHSFVALF